MERIKGFAYLAGGFVLAGTSVIAARFVAGVLGTFTITAISLFFALIALSAANGKRLVNAIENMNGHDWLITILQAVFGIFLFRLFLLNGLLHTSSSEAGVLTGITPAATAILSGAVLKETIGIKSILGITSTVAGVTMLQEFPVSSGIDSSHMFGNLLVMLAALCESIFNILSKISSTGFIGKSKKTSFDPLSQTTIVSGVAFLLCLAPAILEKPLPAISSLKVAGWMSLVWYGLFVTAIAYMLWYAGIKRCSASTAAAFSGIMPFTAMILSVLVLGERPGLPQWAGGILIMLGIVVTGMKKMPLPGKTSVDPRET